MNEELIMLETKMKAEKIMYERAKSAYDSANIHNSPFRMGERVIYQRKEYEISRVNSESYCHTSCKAYPINKDGSVSQTRYVVIYSDVSTFAIKKGKLVEGWEPAPQWAMDAKEDDRKREGS